MPSEKLNIRTIATLAASPARDPLKLHHVPDSLFLLYVFGCPGSAKKCSNAFSSRQKQLGLVGRDSAMKHQEGYG